MHIYVQGIEHMFSVWVVFQKLLSDVIPH